MSDQVKIKRALISVSNKQDLIPFAKALTDQGTQIISTGGTARALKEASIDVVAIDEVTGFPEMMDGRVKTLHPKIHGGLLALRDNEDHAKAMEEHDINPIDLVCVNLYPFEETIRKEGVSPSEVIEQIDIGGPSMLRSSAKNHSYVAVVTDPSQYDGIISELNSQQGSLSLSTRTRLAAAAFARTSAYDTAIASWMQSYAAGKKQDLLSADVEQIELVLKKQESLRYGENPHQRGSLFIDAVSQEPAVAKAKQLHGKALSFNNLYDADGALELVKEIDAEKAAAAAVIKHANPCGFAVSNTVKEAFEKAYEGDPLAAFGGIVAFNSEVDESVAMAIVEGQKFLEVIVAPAYTEAALVLLTQKWKNVRLLETGKLPSPLNRSQGELSIKRITGGLLIQDRDLANMSPDHWSHKAGPKPDESAFHDMVVAMVCVKHLKSNAVCLVNDAQLVGAGAGQMDRLASCNIAIDKAGERAKGATVGSDAFFPFRDGPDKLIKAGVKAIVQPGGSKRDDETIDACEASGVTLMFTGQRHFRH